LATTWQDIETVVTRDVRSSEARERRCFWVARRGVAKRCVGTVARRQRRRQDPRPRAAQPHAAFAPVPSAADQRRCRTNALALVRAAGTRLDPVSILGNAGRLAHGHPCELRSPRATQSHRHRGPASLRAVSFGRDLSDPGDGPAVSGVAQDLQRPVALRSCPCWSVDSTPHLRSSLNAISCSRTCVDPGSLRSTMRMREGWKQWR
jgi:hypothetical protein